MLAAAAGLVALVFIISDDLFYLHGDMQSMLQYFVLFLPVMFLVYIRSSLMQSIDRAAEEMVNTLVRNILLTASFVVATVTADSLTSLW